MLDIHPPHETVHTWRDFFIHIATIVIGLLIAVSLEQTVEFIQHRHSANEARKNIHEETSSDIDMLHFNLQQLDKSRQQLESDLDALNSSTSDADIPAHLEYTWKLGKEPDAAWQAAKIDGSLALIPPAQIGRASYFYDSNDNLTPTLFAYFADVDTAAAIVDHARSTRTLTPPERQQLVSRTESALGYARLLTRLYEYRSHVFDPGHRR